MNEFDGITTEQLVDHLDAVKRELNRRQNARANKLIERVCADLNELRQMGVNFIVEDCDGYDFWVFGTEKPIAPQMFQVKEVY